MWGLKGQNTLTSSIHVMMLQNKIRSEPGRPIGEGKNLNHDYLLLPPIAPHKSDYAVTSSLFYYSK